MGAPVIITNKEFSPTLHSNVGHIIGFAQGLNRNTIKVIVKTASLNKRLIDPTELLLLSEL